MKRNVYVNVVALVIIAAFLSVPVACTKTISIKDFSSQDRATYAMGLWNRIYDSYKVRQDDPNLTEADKQVMRVEKQVLANTKPVISAYNTVVSMGDRPTAAQENELLSVIDQLKSILDKSLGG